MPFLVYFSRAIAQRRPLGFVIIVIVACIFFVAGFSYFAAIRNASQLGVISTATPPPPSVSQTASNIVQPTPTLTTPAPAEPSMFLKPYTVVLKTDPALMLSSNPEEKRAAIDQVRSQMNSCFGTAYRTDNRVAQVVATGYSTNPDMGKRLAEEGAKLLLPEMHPATLESFKYLVGISLDPSLNGRVELEVYYLNSSLDKPWFLGMTCPPPPHTYCSGTIGGQLVIISNWAHRTQNIIFYIDQEQPLSVKPAYGDFRTVGCVLLMPGTHRWRAEVQGLEDRGVLNVVNGKSEQLVFCEKERSLVHDCPGPLPPTPIIGVYPQPTTPIP